MLRGRKLIRKPCIRWTLETAGILDQRRSALEDDFEEEEEKEEEEAAVNGLETMDIDKVSQRSSSLVLWVFQNREHRHC